MKANRSYYILFLCLSVFFLLCSHDLFLKSSDYHLESKQAHEIFLFNGSFDKSENIITRDRIQSPIILGPNYRFEPEEEDWYDKDKATYLTFKAGEAGTYVAGVSTLPRMIELSAKAFNDYLSHDGVTDILALREKLGQLTEPAREQYAKHVKTILKVGATPSQHFKEILHYPLEFVPLQNPYETKVGDEIAVQLLQLGKPLANVPVYARHALGKHEHQEEGEHEHQEEGEHEHQEDMFRTDNEGIFMLPIDHEGVWYVRTIYMVESKEENIDYVSNWATITFEITD